LPLPKSEKIQRIIQKITQNIVKYMIW